MKNIVNVLLAMALAGCATGKNISSVDVLPASAFEASGKGIVLFSAGAPAHCMSTSTFLIPYEAATNKPPPNSFMIPVDSFAVKSDFADHHGTISALSLSPGKYFLSPTIANPYVTAYETPKFGFDVVAGETTYLGELFMTRSCSLNNSYVVRDAYLRDVELAAKRNPAFTRVKPVKRLFY